MVCERSGEYICKWFFEWLAEVNGFANGFATYLRGEG